MKRLHINLHVANLDESVSFYNALFNTAPSVLKNDYAKWLLDEPSVNFSISLSENDRGLNHLGIEATSKPELEEVYANIAATKGLVREEGHTVCCYAQSEKSWVKDPQGVEWEAFHTYGEAAVYKTESTDCCDTNCCA